VTVLISLSHLLATIEFRYVNWRGEEHAYRIDVESIEFGEYGPEGKSGSDVKERWVMHGFVVLRDGKPRDDIGDHPGGNRRTFLVEKMGDVEEIE